MRVPCIHILAIVMGQPLGANAHTFSGFATSRMCTCRDLVFNRGAFVVSTFFKTFFACTSNGVRKRLCCHIILFLCFKSLAMVELCQQQLQKRSLCCRRYGRNLASTNHKPYFHDFSRRLKDAEGVQPLITTQDTWPNPTYISE